MSATEAAEMARRVYADVLTQNKRCARSARGMMRCYAWRWRLAKDESLKRRYLAFAIECRELAADFLYNPTAS